MRKVDNKVEPISTIDTECKQDIRPSTRIAFAQESQIYQKNGISSLHYFSWLSDVFLSIGAIGVLGIIPRHNMLEEPSYWYVKQNVKYCRCDPSLLEQTRYRLEIQLNLGFIFSRNPNWQISGGSLKATLLTGHTIAFLFKIYLLFH